MEKKSILIDYDKEEDMISLFKEGSKSKVSFDLDLPNGNIVVDYDFNGHIVGIEFFNASNYFPMLKNISNFKNLKASLSVQYNKNWVQISYAIFFPDISKPIENIINVPYNKELILAH
jgi:uncharacterized protein YuzE